MNELAVIKQQEVLGKDFKMYGDFENPVVLAKDVAEWIEHSNVSMLLKQLDESEKVRLNLGINNDYIQVGWGGNRKNTEFWFITEKGLHNVLYLSRKPIAKQFKIKVNKMLKQIRTNGDYIPISEYDRP